VVCGANKYNSHPNATRTKRVEAYLNVKGGYKKFADAAGWRRPAHFPRPLLAYHARRFPERVFRGKYAHLFWPVTSSASCQSCSLHFGPMPTIVLSKIVENSGGMLLAKQSARFGVRVERRMAVVTSLRRELARRSLEQSRRFAQLNIYGLGLLALWNTVNIVLLPDQVDATVRAGWRGTALGAISLVGIGVATIAQPFFGRMSDNAPFADRRRPFILIGTALIIPSLAAFGWAPDFAVLVIAYVLMQLAGNFAQAAFQALIPDLADEQNRGLASGVKNAVSVLGSAIGLLGARALLDLPNGLAATLAYEALILIAVAALTYRWVPPVPPLPDQQRIQSLWDAIDPKVVWEDSTRIFKSQRVFRKAVWGQFLLLLGAYPAQRFLLFFLKDRFGIEDPAQTTAIALLVATLLGAVAAATAGGLSDHFGRIPVIRFSIVIVAIGLVGIALSPSVNAATLAGGVLGLGVGIFFSVNWALLSDDIPPGQCARAFGLANIATAGASALAGLFGPLVDIANAHFPDATYPITFGLAAAISLTSLKPFHEI
jgi:MFS family permease